MRPPSNRRLRIAMLAVPMVAFTVAGYVGNALAPTLAHDAPLALLVLNPRLRWLFLTSAKVETLWFFLIPLVRATAVLGVYFLLGRWYGDRALRWLESRAANTMRPLLWVERRFHRSRVAITFLFPGTIAAMLAGADDMATPLFFGVALASIGLRVWAVRALANAFRGTLLDVLDWVGNNQLWLTVLSATSVVGWVMWSNRHGMTQGETIEQIIEDFEPTADPSETV
jgi:hypothetical protein